MPKLPILFAVIFPRSPDPKLVKIIGTAKISLGYSQYSFKGNWTSVSNTKDFDKNNMVNHLPSPGHSTTAAQRPSRRRFESNPGPSILACLRQALYLLSYLHAWWLCYWWWLIWSERAPSQEATQHFKSQVMSLVKASIANYCAGTNQVKIFFFRVKSLIK